MTKCDLTGASASDLDASIESIDLVMDAVTGQHDNPLFFRLLAILSDELDRREHKRPGHEIELALPMAEATEAHIWCLVRFAGAVVKAGDKGQPSAMTFFFAAVILEIESWAQRMASAVNN